MYFNKTLRMACYTVVYAIGALTTSASAMQVLIDRGNDPIGIGLGWEFPGADMKFDVANDPQHGPCRTFEYDFTKGGRYVQMDFGLPQTSIGEIRFWILAQQEMRGFCRLHDSSGQMFIYFFSPTPNAWQEIVIPVDVAQSQGHGAGANDGQFHLPLKMMSIGVEVGLTNKGTYRIGNIRANVADAKFPADVRVRIEPLPQGGVALLNEKTDYAVVLDNRFDSPQSAHISYRIIDQDSKPVAERTLDLAIQPLEVKRVPIAISAEKYGYQQILATVAVAGGKTTDIESGLAVVRTPQRYLQRDPDSFFAMIQDKNLFQAVAKVGAKNVMYSYNWRWMETQPGNYVPAAIPAEQEKCNLGTVIKFNHWTPDWAKWTDAPRPELREYIAPKHLEAFGKWVHHYVTVLKGKLLAVEMINEPDLGYWRGANLDIETAVDLYCKTQKAGYAGAKAADPNLPVWGVGVSSYDQCTGMRFSELVMAHASNDLDTIGNHPYPFSHYIGKGKVAESPEQTNLPAKCRKTLSLLVQHKKKKEMHIGELGWGVHLEEPVLSPAVLEFSQYVARANILVKTVPEVKSVYWFTMDACDEGGYFYGLLRSLPNSTYPLPAACAYATCAGILDHTQCVAPVRIGPGILAWRFDRTDADQSIVVFWATGEPVTLKCALPEGAEIVNSYNQTIGRAPTAEFPIDGFPIYATTSKTSAAALIESLEKGQLRGVKDLRIVNARLIAEDQLEVIIANSTKSSIACSVAFRGRTASVTAQSDRHAVSVSVPAAPCSTELKTETVSIKWPAGEDRLALRTNLIAAMNLSGAESVDAKLQKLVATATPLVRNDRHSVLPPDPNTPWTGADDLSMTSWIGFDENDLYLAIDVVDDIHVPGDAGEGFWMTDAIQVGIDPQMDSTLGYDANDAEIGFAVSKTGPTARLAHPTTSPVKTDALHAERDETKKVTRYRVAIPWTAMNIASPKPGKVMAINIIAGDDDGQGRGYWAGLTPGIAEEKRPEQYLHFVLEKPTPTAK